jgi:hypothetical protein
MLTCGEPATDREMETVIHRAALEQRQRRGHRARLCPHCDDHWDAADPKWMDVGMVESVVLRWASQCAFSISL